MEFQVVAGGGVVEGDGEGSLAGKILQYAFEPAAEIRAEQGRVYIDRSA